MKNFHLVIDDFYLFFFKNQMSDIKDSLKYELQRLSRSSRTTHGKST